MAIDLYYKVYTTGGRRHGRVQIEQWNIGIYGDDRAMGIGVPCAS